MNRKLKSGWSIILCLVLFVALILVVVLGTIQNNKRTEELVKEAQEVSNGVTEGAQNQDENNITNPYKKIKNKKEISMLVLGDYIAQSEGVEEKNKWTSLVTDSIKNDYGVKPLMELLTNTQQGIVGTLENYNKSFSTKKYDFAIISVGAKDVGVLKIEEFRKNYEALIRAIKGGNGNCEVILIIESSITADTTYPDVIKSIGDYYELSYIDARDVFNKSNIDYNKLTTEDKVTPNKDGYKLYGDAIYNLIKTNVEKEREVKGLKKELLYNN